MKKIYLIISLFLFLICSCSTDSLTDTNTSNQSTTVSLSAVLPNGTNTRVTESADATTGLITSWNSSDKLSVLLNTGNMVEMSKDETVNGFTATVSESDLNAFKSGSIVYGVNNNSSDQITTLLQNGKLNTVVDFTGQNGSLDNISKYDLMYGSGDASTAIRFHHKACIMRFDLSSSLLSGKVTSATFVFVPSAASPSLFADKETYNFGDTSDSTIVDATSYTLSNPSIDVVDNKASVYLAIPMRKAVSGILTLNLTCTDGSAVKALTLSKNITIANKNFYPATVQAKAISSLANAPAEGEYVFSDGTWGALANNPSKTAIGVFFSSRISDEEKAAGFIHGYAMALNDASSSGVTWNGSGSGSGTDLIYLNNNPTSNLWYNDMSSGYIGTVNHGMGQNQNDTYPAWEAAYNYKNTVSTSTFFNSGWYLPTAGQWFDLVEKLGGDEALNTALVHYQTTAEWALQVSSSSALTNINKKFTDAGGKPLLNPLLDYNWIRYWSSTENNANNATVFFMTPNMEMYSYDKKESHAVRSVLAF